MKVPPKRKGNERGTYTKNIYEALNESPSEKEGKCYGSRDGESTGGPQ